MVREKKKNPRPCDLDRYDIRIQLHNKIEYIYIFLIRTVLGSTRYIVVNVRTSSKFHNFLNFYQKLSNTNYICTSTSLLLSFKLCTRRACNPLSGIGGHDVMIGSQSLSPCSQNATKQQHNSWGFRLPTQKTAVTIFCFACAYIRVLRSTSYFRCTAVLYILQYEYCHKADCYRSSTRTRYMCAYHHTKYLTRYSNTSYIELPVLLRTRYFIDSSTAVKISQQVPSVHPRQQYRHEYSYTHEHIMICETEARREHSSRMDDEMMRWLSTGHEEPLLPLLTAVFFCCTAA